jgi:hypothetical protein
MTTTKLSPLAFIGRLLKLYLFLSLYECISNLIFFRSQRQAVCSSSSSSHDSKDGEEEFHPTLEPGTEPNISHLCEKNADLDVLPGDFAIMDKHHMVVYLIINSL